MANLLPVLLKISLVLFMVANLLEMGLRIRLRDALGGLRDVRFVVQSLVWGFVLCPALAWLLARVVPFPAAYGTGLILLGMTPCAPFLPMMVARARGDMNYAAALMVLASVGTAFYLPFALPYLISGLNASTWTIAKPLIIFLLIPMGVGVAIQQSAPQIAPRMIPWVRKVAGPATLAMLVLCFVIYYKGMLGAIGSFAIATQVLFFTVITLGPYAFSFGLPPERKSVLALGMSTRNLGAAMTPLFAAANTDPRSIIMVVIGVPLQVLAAWLFALWFARRTRSDATGPA